jgi:hypothetical protein
MEQHPPIPPGGDKDPVDQHHQLPPGFSEPEHQDPTNSHPERHSQLPGDHLAPATDTELPPPDAPDSVVSALATAVPAEAADRDAREPAPERRSNKALLAAAKQPIERVAMQVRRNENLPGIRDLAEFFITSDSLEVPPHLLHQVTAGGRRDAQEVRRVVTDSAIFRLWSRSKVVYAMDDLLLGYLSETSPATIPTQVLGNLPHPDPFILLPQPDFGDPETAYYRTHICVPSGAFVFGRYNQAQQLTSTANVRREDFGLMFVGFREAASVPDLITLRCTIPLQGKTFTVEDAVNATIAKFHFNDQLAEDNPAKLEAWLRTYVAQAFNSLLYVCTEQPDIEVYQPGAGRGGKQAKSRARRRPRPEDIDTVVKLGFRMGPALHEARRHWERSQPQAEAGTNGSGRRVRPHQKKGHYRTYWTGTGRTEVIVRWIAPFWVNERPLDASDEPRDVVVRRVRKPR